MRASDPDFEQFANQASPEAFRRLADHYADAMYSVAVRVLGQHRHLADDVLQAVLVVLSQKAARLPREIELGAWLHRQIVRHALNAIRAEQRRVRRETKAAELHTMNACESDEQRWAEVMPHVDQELLRLSSADRQALVWRFFEQRELKDIGEQLGVSAGTMQKRISRALDMLRERLARHGVVLPSVALGALMSARFVEAAPAALAARLASSALAAATSGTGFITALVNTMTTSGKLLTGTALLALLCGGAYFGTALSKQAGEIAGTKPASIAPVSRSASARQSASPQLASPSPSALISASPDDDGRTIFLNLYNPYLDSLCLRPSDAEWKRLLADATGDPDRLVALASLCPRHTQDLLDRALRLDPMSASALYRAITNAFFKGDKVALAKRLGSSFAHHHVAATLCEKPGIAPSAIVDELRLASRLPVVCSSRSTMDHELEAYQKLGRDPLGAKARVFLEERGQAEALTLSGLHQRLQTTGAYNDPALGQETLTLMLAAVQSMRFNPDFDLNSHESAVAMEEQILKLLQTRLGPENRTVLSVSIKEALAEAWQENHSNYEIMFFSHDKPGLFQRLTREQQARLLDNIRREGEEAAYTAVFKERPDVFTDPNFKPQGMSADYWRQYLQPLTNVAETRRKQTGGK